MKPEHGLLHKAARTLYSEGPVATTSKILSRLQLIRDGLLASRRLHAISGASTSIDESLDIAFGLSVKRVTIAPAQIRSEIGALLQTLRADPPHRILELGTAGGGTLFLLSRVATSDALIATIDLPGGEFGGGYGTARIPLLKAMPRKGQSLKLIRGDSHDSRTLQSARRWFQNQPLDFLLIDGDHRFDGVRLDFLTYGPMVRPGGLIALHDIVPGPAALVGDVPSFWNIIRRAYDTREFVHDWSQGGFGLGVVKVPEHGLAIDPSIADSPRPDGFGEPDSFT